MSIAPANAAVDVLDQHDRRGDRSADVDDELDDLDPDDRFHSAVEREDDHHDAEQKDRADDDAASGRCPG